MLAINNKYRTSSLFKVIVPVLITGLFAFYGCKGTQAPPPAAKAVKPQPIQTAGSSIQQPQAESAVEDTLPVEGYIYDQRDRRDPFIPLILPTKEVVKKDVIKVGTLEGYDLNDFVLSAIARMGTRYYALLTTPDNRSFTINEGDVIGLNKGKVEEISSNEVVLVEYARDYRGEIKPRKIILEFLKGE
jgi:Tfp pilus assembly protein PilP